MWIQVKAPEQYEIFTYGKFNLKKKMKPNVIS